MEIPDVHILVQSVANKQRENKRKRDPDMYLDAVLECTVRKLNRERMESDEVLRKRRKIEQKDAECHTFNNENALSLNSSTKCAARTVTNNSTITENSPSSLSDLDEEFSSELKELLDELSREFPGDFWLSDSNNEFENADSDGGDVWLSGLVEVLCST